MDRDDSPSVIVDSCAPISQPPPLSNRNQQRGTKLPRERISCLRGQVPHLLNWSLNMRLQYLASQLWKTLHYLRLRPPLPSMTRAQCPLCPQKPLNLRALPWLQMSEQQIHSHPASWSSRHVHVACDDHRNASSRNWQVAGTLSSLTYLYPSFSNWGG